MLSPRQRCPPAIRPSMPACSASASFIDPPQSVDGGSDQGCTGRLRISQTSGTATAAVIELGGARAGSGANSRHEQNASLLHLGDPKPQARRYRRRRRLALNSRRTVPSRCDAVTRCRRSSLSSLLAFAPPCKSQRSGPSSGQQRRRLPGRDHSGMAGEIILERRARSNRNGGRHHRGFPGNFPRNPHRRKPAICATSTMSAISAENPHPEFGSMPPSARLLPFGPASAEAEHAVAGQSTLQTAIYAPAEAAGALRYGFSGPTAMP